MQARINTIVARFNPAALAAPATAAPATTTATTATGSDFASVLADTLAASDSRTSMYGAGSGASGIATAATVSSLNTGYENGRLPDSALTSIGIGSHRLAAPAADAFKQMRAAAAAEGVDIGVTDSYRSYDAQVDVARRKGLYSQGGLAAKPGTSDHGLGLALDLDLDATAQTWMRTNGKRFGFVEDTPREPWHWKFDGV